MFLISFLITSLWFATQSSSNIFLLVNPPFLLKEFTSQRLKKVKSLVSHKKFLELNFSISLVYCWCMQGLTWTYLGIPQEVHHQWLARLAYLLRKMSKLHVTKVWHWLDDLRNLFLAWQHLKWRSFLNPVLL